MKKKIHAADFYDFYPPNTHQTGDIWRGIPTYGLLGEMTTSAVVISPSCDLAQRKTETVTLLPIISVASYFNSPAAYYEIWQEAVQVLQKCGISSSVLAPDRFELPIMDEIAHATQLVKTWAGENAARKDTLARMEAYSLYLTVVSAGSSLPLTILAKIFANGNFEKNMKRVITNAYKADIHFLPKDGASADAAAMPEHSVVLLRYPISIPISVLSRAQTATVESWQHTGTGNFFGGYPRSSFFPICPIRMLNLKDDFLSDLLSRYVGLQIRLGSRDFTDDTIDALSAELVED